jgi:hypothetical protein
MFSEFLPGLGLLLLLATASQGAMARAESPRTPKGQKMHYKIVYWTNEVGERSFLELNMESSKPVTLFVGSNEAEPGPSPVGRFQSTAATSEATALLESIQRLVASPLPELQYGIPGSRIREFRISLEGRPEEIRRAVEGSEPDSHFLTTEKAAVALVNEVKKHPQTALSAQSTLVLNSSGRFDIQVRLSNVSPEIVRIPHPDLWSDGAMSIEVGVLRNDIALADLNADHQHFLHLSRGQLIDIWPPLKSGKVIAIAPRQALLLNFSAKLPLPKGGYDAWVSLTTNIVDAKGEALFRIGFETRKQPQQVR